MKWTRIDHDAGTYKDKNTPIPPVPCTNKHLADNMFNQSGCYANTGKDDCSFTDWKDGSPLKSGQGGINNCCWTNGGSWGEWYQCK
jgi:hypothetical protein